MCFFSSYLKKLKTRWYRILDVSLNLMKKAENVVLDGKKQDTSLVQLFDKDENQTLHPDLQNSVSISIN